MSLSSKLVLIVSFLIKISSSETRLLSVDFSIHLVSLNPAPFLPSTACLNSDLLPSNQQPMNLTNTLPTFWFSF